MKLHFPDETPLAVVIEAIRKEAGKDLAIEVDREGLKKARISSDLKVKIDVEGIPLKAALTQVVRQAKLIYTVKGSKATVTADTYKEPDPKALDAEMSKIDTTGYATGYDEARFRSIEVGMTEAEVHKRIGKPLREAKAKPQIDWYYGPPTLRITEDGGMFDTSGFFNAAWGYTIARAAADGKILEILGGYFPDVPRELVGLDLAEMKRKYGEPITIRTLSATRYLVYSALESLRELSDESSRSGCRRGRSWRIIAGLLFRLNFAQIPKPWPKRRWLARIMTPPGRPRTGTFLRGAMTMTDFGDLDGQFVFYAVVTPDGKIPTVEDDSSLNDPSHWYTSPIGTIAHLSEFALVFTDHDDAEADLAKHQHELPEGTRVRAFTVVVEEIDTDHHDEISAQILADRPE